MNNPLTSWLQTKYIAQNVIVLDHVDSTNNYAKELITSEPPDGTVIIAHRQVAGKGQLDRNWYSPEGGLYYTCLNKLEAPDGLSMFTLAVGLACHEAINDLCGIKTTLKWVNDIEINGKKLGGILTESRTRGFSSHLITGIGINIHLDTHLIPEELKDKITSLNIESNREINKFELAAILSNSLEKYINLFNENQIKLLKSLWIKNSNTLGRKVVFKDNEQDVAGLIIDISNFGELVIQSYQGKQYLLSSNIGLAYID